MIATRRLLAAWLAAGLLTAPGLRAQETGSLQGLVNIRFQNDIRLFTVMAALNAAGFDEETDGDAISGVRAAVRRDLATLDAGLKQRLQTFYRDRLESQPRQDQPQAAYTSLALLLSGPPEFELQAEASATPADAQHVRGFEALAAEFYRSADVAGLWERYRPAYESELRSYEPVLRSVIKQTLDYFRVPARVVLDREIVLIPDLLDKRDIVNARNLERVYYIVVGPSNSPANNRTQLQHEYLHFLVDPLIRKFGVSLMAHQDLLDLAQRQPDIRSEYQNRYLLMVTESLIESLQLEMSDFSAERLDRELVELFRRGLILAPYFHRGLLDYRRSEMMSLPTYMESLFEGVKADEIRKDEQRIAELESGIRDREAAERARREAAEAEAQRSSRRNVLFQEATEALQASDSATAEAKLAELLQIAPDHGGAWFYLGQIAFQRRDYDQALEHYRKSAEASDSPTWVRAWSRVRVGRLLAARGRFDEARRQFQQVEGMEGDLQGAREKAVESLAELDRRPGR